MHITQIKKFNNIIKVDVFDEVFLTKSLKSVKAIPICCYHNIDYLILGKLLKLESVRINELKKLFKCESTNILHSYYRLLRFSHAYSEHTLKETASRGKYALVSFDLAFTQYESYISKRSIL